MDQESSLPRNEPAGTNVLLYILFFVLGLGSLFPWNAFISETEYFEARFCNGTGESNFESVFGIAYNLSNLVALALLIKIQEHIREQVLITAPLVLFAATFVCLALLVLVDINHDTIFTLTVILVVICGFISAPFIAGICGLGASFPSIYVSAIFSGQAFAGVVVSFTSWITTYFGTHIDTHSNATTLEIDECAPFSTDWSAFSYFVVAIAMSFICLVAYAKLKTYPPTIEHENQIDRHIQHQQEQHHQHDHPSGELQESLLPDMTEDDTINLLHVIHKVKVCAFCVFFNFFVSLSLFPALAETIISVNHSTNSALVNDLFTPTIFLLFNIGDFVGRILAGKRMIFDVKTLPIACVCRIIFFPMLMFCKLNVTNAGIPQWFAQSDVFPILFNIIFGISNGYCQSIAMMLGPKQVGKYETDMASTVMVFALTAGLTVGSFFSFIVVDLVS